MKSTDATPPYETNEIGTPKDYTSDVYRCYFEVGEHDGAALKIFQDYLGSEKSRKILPLAHGYELDLAIQCVPDLVRELAKGGIGVYQVIRYAKTNGVWE